MITEDQISLRDNPARHRFEAQVGELTAVAEYRLRDKVITFTHTEVPHPLEGRGVGSKLAKWALDFSRGQGYRVIPQCPFIAKFIQRHAEYSDLIAG